MSDADLRALFEPFCAVCETVIKQGKASSGTGIYSFVTLFASDDVAETAIRTLAGRPLTGMPGKPNQLKIRANTSTCQPHVQVMKVI